MNFISLSLLKATFFKLWEMEISWTKFTKFQRKISRNWKWNACKFFNKKYNGIRLQRWQKEYENYSLHTHFIIINFFYSILQFARSFDSYFKRVSHQIRPETFFFSICCSITQFFWMFLYMNHKCYILQYRICHSDT